MAEDDVAELRQEYEQDRKKKKAKKGSKASSSSDPATTEEAPPPLSLGMDLLDEDEDFAQVVAMAAMQVRLCWMQSFHCTLSRNRGPVIQCG